MKILGGHFGPPLQVLHHRVGMRELWLKAWDRLYVFLEVA